MYLLHGGAGAPGYMSNLARRLCGEFHIIEPLQRRSGGEPLTVAVHVCDLQEVIEATSADRRPVIVGHSWGAMLGLAHAAAQPAAVAALALIGCGTFDPQTRAELHRRRAARMSDEFRQREAAIASIKADADARFREMGRLYTEVDSRLLIPHDDGLLTCDARGCDETWSDVLRLEQGGVCPAAFATIDAPVLMLHGDFDPHPGAMIRDSLAPHIRNLAYIEYADCGHHPWLEAACHDRFVADLAAWLRGRFASGAAS